MKKNSRKLDRDRAKPFGPVIDLEPHEWRRAGQWFFPSWPPWNWRPFVFLYVLLPGLAVASIADFLRYLGF